MKISRRFVLSLPFSALILSGCIHKSDVPNDPYESINRKIYRMNTAVDGVVLKPAAKVYQAVLPSFVRRAVNNVYDNVYMIPTVANDLLQGKVQSAVLDSWRLLVNTTFGVAGLIDVATTFGLPPHKNDLGLTFAAWGDKNSPYIVIPFLGPSTIRDGMGMLFDFTFLTPYPYIRPPAVLYGVIALRYVDVRSQFLDMDKLMDQALDKYAFMRDAYLQHRQYLITGEQAQGSNESELYVE